MPSFLKELDYENNLLTISYFNNNPLEYLEMLDCSNYDFSLLSLVLPKKLTKLFCNNNKLTTLLKAPENLEELYCRGNNFTIFSIISFKKLRKLNCSNNNLTLSFSIPETSEGLDCSENKLTSLPIMPSRFKFFRL